MESVQHNIAAIDKSMNLTDHPRPLSRPADQSRRAFVQMILTAAVGAGTPARAVSNTSVVEKTRALLESMHDNVLDTFLTDWPVTQKQERREVVPASLPVLRWLGRVKRQAPAFSIELVREMCRAAPRMAWRQTYKAPDVDAEFLNNYGWSEIAGLSGEVPSTRVACGFLLLGPATYYPRHRHEAQEIYLPLVGTASWQQGDGPWREHPPGTLVHHASNEPHAMRTSRQPLLAAYLWHSADLNQKSHLDPTGQGAS